MGVPCRSADVVVVLLGLEVCICLVAGVVAVFIVFISFRWWRQWFSGGCSACAKLGADW